jgi:hypothetical protein
MHTSLAMLESVMRGLDPRIHQFSQKCFVRRMMDRRVEPGDDDGGEGALFAGPPDGLD